MDDINAEALDIAEEGDIEYIMGINIDKVDIDTYHMYQPQLTNQIVLSSKTPSNMPYLTTNILVTSQSAKTFDQHFHYHSVIVKIDYLEKTILLDIAYTVHQCA